MTRAPRLSARMKALEEAAMIAEERARICRDAADRCERKYPRLRSADLAASWECDVVARLIRERMQNRRAR